MFSSRRFMELVWKYQIVLGCSAAAATMYVIVQDVNAKELLRDTIVSLTALRDEHAEVLQFIDTKNLRNEFVEFSQRSANS